MIYGPFAVMQRGAEGQLTESPAPGVHYITSSETFDEHQAALEPYQVTPAGPLQNVLAGDDPANPAWTIALRFPDQATADAVIAALTPAS